MELSFKDLLTVNVKYPQITVFEEAETFSMAVITNDPINNWDEAKDSEPKIVDEVIEDFKNWRLPTVNEATYIREKIKENSNYNNDAINYFKSKLKNKFIVTSDEFDDYSFYSVFVNNGNFKYSDYTNNAIYPISKNAEIKLTVYVR